MSYRCNTFINRLSRIRAQSVMLCACIHPEDSVIQPIEGVSPSKWHLAHTTWFFEEFILKAFNGKYKSYHERYGYLFNSYYEGVGERVLRKNRGFISRPALEEVYDYRRYVDEALINWIDSGQSLPDRVFELLEWGLNHEQQHQELLLTDIKYTLDQNPLHPAYCQDLIIPVSKPVLRESYSHIEEGIYEIGHSKEGFCFDNECGLHKVYVQSFQIGRQLITNEQYQEFIKAGGYQNFKFWHAEGWDWLKTHNIQSPLYWNWQEGMWQSYTLSGLQSLDPQAPVCHVSFYEAAAFAQWCGKRLPTEFEWEIACKQLSPKILAKSNLLEQNFLHPCVLDEDDPQFFGSVWEWTQSAYLPYPRYQKANGAVGEYNGKFMVNQMVLRGGSCVTPRDHIRATYRNFFHPDKQWQFSGIRLAQDI